MELLDFSFISWIASIVWLFFSLLGQIAVTPLRDVLNGIDITAGNPFNDTTWDLHLGTFSDITQTIFEWILEFIDMPELTVIESVLFVFLTIFTITVFVRLISMVTPD